MLSMPQKPLKKVSVAPEGEGRYRLTFLSAVQDEDEFKQMIEEDIKDSLGENDSIVDPDWETKSLILITDDLDSFLMELNFHFYMTKNECPCE